MWEFQLFFFFMEIIYIVLKKVRAKKLGEI